MTEWWWSGSLDAWADMCRLRLDDHAQMETQEVAEQINRYMDEAFPISWRCLMGEYGRDV
jgi:thymidylate synthase (FAD)